MTVIVTRDVPDRFRGFLASCALEIGPGIYTSPRMTAAVRERVWAVMCEWHGVLKQGSIVMTWADPKHRAGQRVLALGFPAKEIVDHDGVLMVRRETEGPELP